jgi:hypothetical protein
MTAIPWRVSQKAPMSADVALRPQVIEGEAEVVRSVVRVRRSAWEWYGDVVHVSVPAVWWYLFAAIILAMFTRPWGFLWPVVLGGYLMLSAACVLGWKVSRRRERAFLAWVAEKEGLPVDGQRTDRVRCGRRKSQLRSERANDRAGSITPVRSRMAHRKLPPTLRLSFRRLGAASRGTSLPLPAARS